jgi:hypothetical protein
MSHRGQCGGRGGRGRRGGGPCRGVLWVSPIRRLRRKCTPGVQEGGKVEGRKSKRAEEGAGERAWEGWRERGRTFKLIVRSIACHCTSPSGAAVRSGRITLRGTTLPLSSPLNPSVAFLNVLSELTHVYSARLHHPSNFRTFPSLFLVLLSPSSPSASPTSTLPPDSMNDTQSSPEGPCAVCGEVTKQRCSSCAEHGFEIFQCSPSHRDLVRLSSSRSLSFLR